MLAKEPSGTAEAERGREFARVDVAPAVALPRHGQNRVGSDVDAAVDAGSYVYAQERVRRVGHRIDQPLDEVGAFRHEPVVLAAERNDGGRSVVTGEAGERIGLQAAAQHHPGEVVN